MGGAAGQGWVCTEQREDHSLKDETQMAKREQILRERCSQECKPCHFADLWGYRGGEKSRLFYLNLME